jgi:hypothetical protein
MPRNAIDYSKTLMYKLVCNDLNVPYNYVGHTTSFKDRKKKHKSNCYNEKNKSHNLKVYKTIRENGGWDNWTMMSIENFPCNDVNEATKRERYWYEELNADLNMRNPNRNITDSSKNYYETHKEIIAEKAKIKYENNKEIIKEKRKEKITCECGKITSNQHLSRHKKTIKHQNFINNI